MPIRIPDTLPAFETLVHEGVRVMTETMAIRQDIRPLQIGLLALPFALAGHNARAHGDAMHGKPAALVNRLRGHSGRFELRQHLGKCSLPMGLGIGLCV